MTDDMWDRFGRGEDPADILDGPEPRSLAEVHTVFRRWLGDSYDLDTLDAALAAAAVNQIDGDPVWLLIVSGSGNTKTETVQALAGDGAHITSTITSEGALLSATPRKDTGSNATGGLLRKIGNSGVLVIKDVTSILSMNRDTRAQVLAALREVYDGRWERNVGVDGGRTLTWEGRLVLIGAVTTAWDRHHAVIAAMGDRFALIRSDSSTGRRSAGRQALRNVGDELEMRAELSAAVGGVLASTVDVGRLDEDTEGALLDAADLVTLARTAVSRDYQGNVEEAEMPEAPTRFAKMLAQLVRGGLAIGQDKAEAVRVALRVARDSMPPLRLDALTDVMDHPGASLTDVIARLDKPRRTVDRTLQELHLLGLLHQDRPEQPGGGAWRYHLAENEEGTRATTLRALLTRKVSTRDVGDKEEGSSPAPDTDVSGKADGSAKSGESAQQPEQPPPATRQSSFYDRWPDDAPTEPPDDEWPAEQPDNRCVVCRHLLPPNHREAGLVLCAPCTAVAELHTESEGVA